MDRPVVRRLAALELLEEMWDRGLEVQADRREKMVYAGPSPKLTPSLRQRIRRHKPALLEILDPDSPEGPCECGGTSYVRTALGPWRCTRCTDLPPEEIVSAYVGPDRWRDGG